MKYPHEITPEVSDTIDRLAAAFICNDVRRAREVLNDQRLRWIAEGKQAEHDELARRARSELYFNHSANAWFETKDGIRMKDKISSGIGEYPPVWKRACRSRNLGTYDRKDDAITRQIEVRTYEWTCERDRGIPVYKEV